MLDWLADGLIICRQQQQQQQPSGDRLGVSYDRVTEAARSRVSVGRAMIQAVLFGTAVSRVVHQ